VTTTELALPTTGDSSAWNESEKALVEAAGLTSQRGNGPKTFAPRPVVEAFLMQCRRTGLDPIARQIYCIQRAGKWQTQVSIDGARLVAERSGDYEGQTAPQWSEDGRTWYDAWIASDEEEAHPRFARVGVYRRGFREALTVVARWESYAVYEDVWENNQKTGRKRLSAMWKKMPDLMLAKVAEMLALRKAFPQDLSGLYSTEEMQQADRQAQPTQPAPAAATPATTQAAPVATINWALQIADASTVPELGQVFARAQEAGELGLPFAPEHQQHVEALVQLFELSQPPANVKVGQMIGAVKVALEKQAEQEGGVVEGEVVYDGGQSAEDEADQQHAHHMHAEPVTEWPTAQPGGGDR
jgi:phage recombination protein Bet